jgi:hypothetical protein
MSAWQIIVVCAPDFALVGLMAIAFLRAGR